MLSCSINKVSDSPFERPYVHNHLWLWPNAVTTDIFLPLVCSQLVRNFWKFHLRAPKFKCTLFSSPPVMCQCRLSGARFCTVKKSQPGGGKEEKKFFMPSLKISTPLRTVIKIKNCRRVWRWNRMLSLSSIWAQFCVMPFWDSLCIFITRGGGKVSAQTQLPCSNFSTVTSFPPVCRCMAGNTCRMSWPELLSGQCLLIQLAPLKKYTVS